MSPTAVASFRFDESLWTPDGRIAAIKSRCTTLPIGCNDDEAQSVVPIYFKLFFASPPVLVGVTKLMLVTLLLNLSQVVNITVLFIFR